MDYLIAKSQYKNWYQQSQDNPQAFWAEQATKFVDWIKPWNQIQAGDFQNANVRWFLNGKLNVTYNCIDRHLEKHGNRVAFIWVGDEPGVSKKVTYQELHEQVCRLANVLKSKGVSKGQRVCIYMPMILEAVYAMLACARIGAVHSVVFGGFSPHSLRDRILDADCRVVITADGGMRGGKFIPLKMNTDKALTECPQVSTVIVVKHTQRDIEWDNERDVWYHDAVAKAAVECAPEVMDAEDPLFILYTSGSTGKPKGLLHTTGGYLVYAAMTHKYVFDYQDDEIYWCTADVGWITGHSYIVYGPLANAATNLIFEGVPTYPDFSRFWKIVDEFKVNIFYTAPTAIRALMREGDDYVKQTSRTSLRILGTVGEPINPEAWRWYHDVIGNNKCPIVDTWWQTETGGIMITPLPGATKLKPGSASWPFFGVKPAVVDDHGHELSANTAGYLVIQKPWPAIARTIYGDHQRYIDTYFTKFPGCYNTGDGAKCDDEGYYWITGRVDDVVNVSGHRIGTAEVESALVAHHDVAEAAVVGIPDEIKGQALVAYVILKQGVTGSDKLKAQLIQQITDEIGAIAKPKAIHFVKALPKTRSGKIMRRILRLIAEGKSDLKEFGDLSTLADPDVVKDLIAQS